VIEEYQFGLIKINGKTYTHDVEIHSTGEVFKWWRKEGHFVDLEDIEKALKKKPEVIVIGTGAMGVAQVSEKIKKEIPSQGIEIIIDHTDKAVKIFNQLSKKKKSKKLCHGTIFQKVLTKFKRSDKFVNIIF